MHVALSSCDTCQACQHLLYTANKVTVPRLPTDNVALELDSATFQNDKDVFDHERSTSMGQGIAFKESTSEQPLLGSTVLGALQLKTYGRTARSLFHDHSTGKMMRNQKSHGRIQD